MAKVQEIGPYSAYALAVKYGYQGTEEEWVQEQEANRKAAEAAAAAAAQSAKNAAASASGAAQSGQQAVQSIKNAQTAAEQAIDTAKQQAVQAAQAEAEKAAASAGQAASSAAEAAQSATNAAAEVGKVQSAGTSAVQSVREAQNTATGAVADAQRTATQAVSQAQTAAVSAVQTEGTKQTNAVASAASSALTGISGAKDAALSDVAEAGTAQVSAVGTAGADAVEDVNDAKTAALEAIDAANAALPSPTQSDAGKVPTVKADGSAYELAGPYAPLSAAIRPTVSGNPVSITDSVEWPLQGLKVYGKSTQDGTPSPESPVPIVSAGGGGEIDVTINGAQLFDGKTYHGLDGINAQNVTFDDGVLSYSATGTDSYIGVYGSVGQNLALEKHQMIAVHPGTYYCFSVEGDFNKNFVTELNADFVVVKQLISFSTDLYLQVSDQTAYVTLRFGVSDSISGTRYSSKVMVSLSPIPVPYEPYKSQILTSSTPNGLPGIPVESGGNFTDVDGQRWICDVKDYAAGKYTQNLKKILLDESQNWIKSSISSEGYSSFYVKLDGKIKSGSKLFCNRFEQGTYTDWETGAQKEFVEYPDAANSRNSIGVRLATSRIGTDDVDSFKTWLIQNPTEVFVCLDTAVTSDIPAEELAAYRALTTYDGTTVVSTAEDVAGLEVEYLADGEKYVERIVSQKAPEAAAAHTMALLANGIREGVNGV